MFQNGSPKWQALRPTTSSEAAEWELDIAAAKSLPNEGEEVDLNHARLSYPQC